MEIEVQCTRIIKQGEVWHVTFTDGTRVGPRNVTLTPAGLTLVVEGGSVPPYVAGRFYTLHLADVSRS